MDDAAFVFSLSRIGKALRREFEARAAALEITAPQFQVLHRLWRGDGILTSELTRDICSDGATTTGLLDRLEAKELVRRERSVEDRRAVRIFVTEQGSALRESLMIVLGAVNRQALEGFSAPEQADLLRTLERVTANLGEMAR